MSHFLSRALGVTLIAASLMGCEEQILSIVDEDDSSDGLSTYNRVVAGRMKEYTDKLGERNAYVGFAAASAFPTSGAATYAGGFVMDMTQGETGGDVVAGKMTVEASFSATDVELNGTLNDAYRLTMGSDDYTLYLGYLDGTSTPTDAEVAAVLEAATGEGLSGDLTFGVQNVPTADSRVTTNLTGTLQGDSSEIFVDDDIFAFVSGDDAEAVYATGDAGGFLEVVVDGVPRTIFFEGLATK